MGFVPREWFSTGLFRAKRLLLANSPVFGTLASPKPAANAVQKGTLQPRANPGTASTVSSLAIARTTVLCRPCVACAWLKKMADKRGKILPKTEKAFKG